jgi:hypothetical protein
MVLGIVVQRGAMIGVNTVLECPGDGVSPGYKIEVIRKGHRIIQADVVVSEYTLVNYRRSERDDPPLLPPDKKSRAVIHPLTKLAKIRLREFFKFEF